MKARFGLSSIKAFERLKTIRMEDFDSWDAYSLEVRILSSAVGKELELAALISGAPADIAPHLRAVQKPTVDTVSSVGRALCSIPVPTPTGLVASPEGPRKRSRGKCRICQKQGHFAADCPEASKNQQRSLHSAVRAFSSVQTHGQ
ncbi:hypothetical protein Ciccas_013627 [Cichlidogyrus casuarinus]|uniref:CCHC-type domain-containing protein n=1 Tax=Cichlidogyrus casuarinus TaxID=1844966 RepID=A0ABD2PKL6_9PLAT